MRPEGSAEELERRRRAMSLPEDAGLEPGLVVLVGMMALVALRLGRAAIGVELNPQYARMARLRFAVAFQQTAPVQVPPTSC